MTIAIAEPFQPEDVAAIFCTMNRQDTALECARRLAAQSLKIGKLIVADNCSSDGSADELEKLGRQLDLALEVIRLPENLGNAGGVRTAMDEAFRQGHEAVWILDDDSWPEQNAFELLLDPQGPAEGIRTSVVLAPSSDELSWPCEILDPHNAWRFARGTIQDSAQWIRVRRSWLGALIPRSAYLKIGPVNADLFLRGEDEDYPRRLGDAGFLFWASKGSILRHPISGKLLTLALGDFKLSLEQNLTGDKLYYRVRNMVWIKNRESGFFASSILFIGYLFLILRSIRPLGPALAVFREAVSDAFAGRLGKRSGPGGPALPT